MKAIFTITTKELLDILRDKTLIVILTLPLLLFSATNINMQFITQEHLFSSSYRVACLNLPSDIQSLVKQENIDIISNLSNPSKLLNINDIDCIIQQDKDNNIIFIYNSSSLFSRTATAKIATIIGKKIEGMEKSKNSALPLCYIRDELGRDGSDVESLTALIIPTLFIILLSHSGLAFVNDLFAGEREHRTLELLLLSGISKNHLYLGKAFAVSVVNVSDFLFCIISYWGFYGMPDSMQSSFYIIITMLSFTFLLAFLTSTISLISPNRRVSQIANELICCLPIIGAFYLIFSNNQSFYFSFIPLFNSLMVFCRSSSFSPSWYTIFAILLTNIIACGILTLFSSFYLKNERILFS